MKPVLAHPTPAQLAAFALGRLEPAVQSEVERHVARCPQCCQALRDVPNDTFVERLRQANTPTSNPPQGSTPANTPPPAHPEVPAALANHSRYRLLKALGAGGMGVVYLAEHRLMERPVALKVISPSLMSDPNAIERFRREVKAAARLAHPNIVTAHDAEQAGDLHFFVMEYVEGISLARYATTHAPLPIGQACHFTRQAALGLQHAFEQGMVHRDIKPQNLILTRKGQVKILDFGLARFARAQEPAEPAPPAGLAAFPSTGLTGTGAVLGTPDYMAPEQASNSREVDIRADIYSLGCTLYHLLAGRVPFPGGSSMEKLFAHFEQVPEPLAQIRPDVPAELQRVIERMMAKDPSQRYQRPAEVAEALAPFARLARTDAAPAAPARLAAGSGATMPLAATAGGNQAMLAPAVGASYATLPIPVSKRSSRRRTALVVALGLGLAAAGLWLTTGGFRNPPQSTNPGPVASTGTPDSPLAKGATSPGSGTRQVLLVLPSEKFWYPDYAPVRRVLEEGGLRVKVACATSAPATPDPRNAGAVAVKPDIVLSEARPADFDAVVVLGGEGVREFKSDSPTGQAVAKLLRDMQAADKIVAGHCTGAPILAHWGLLRGKQATGFHWTRDVMVKDGGVEYLDQPVVVAGKFITGRNPEDSTAFAQELLRQLKPSR